MRAFLLVLLSAVLAFAGAPALAGDDPKPPAPPADPPKPDAPPKPDPAKEAARGRIGFEPCPAVLVPAEIARNLGMLPMDSVVVIGVTRGGPAYQAGVLVGDLLLKVNGKDLPSTADIDTADHQARQKYGQAFVKLVEDVKPGDEVVLLLKRKGEELTLKPKAVSLAAIKRIEKGLPAEDEPKPAPGEVAADQGVAGFEVVPASTLTEKQREDWNVKSASAVIVSRVVKGSPADLAGLKRGDGLLKYQGVELPSAQDLADAGKDAEAFLRDAIAKIEAGLKVDGEVEFFLRRDFKPWKLKAKAISREALNALIEAEAKGGGAPPAEPPKEQPPAGDKPPEPAPKDK